MKKISQKKNLIWSGIAILILVVMAGAVALSLTQQAEALPDNPINGTELKRSQKLVTGTGFTIDKEQEKEHKKQEKIREKQKKAEQKAKGNDKTEQTPDTGGNKPVPGDSDAKSDGDKDQGQAEKPNKPDPPKPDVVDKEAPSVETKLVDQTVKSFISFKARGWDYQKNYIDLQHLKVTVNGKRLYSSGTQGSTNKWAQYTATIEDNVLRQGKNTIKITVTDPENGKSASLTRTITCNSNAKEEVEGKIRFSLEAHDIGKGYLIAPMYVEVPSEKPLSYTVNKVLREHNYIPDSDGSLGIGFYLKRVKKANITAGYKIPDDLQKKMEEAGVEVNTDSIYKDSLGQKDFTRDSGWVYTVNGSSLNQGMNAYRPKDGDEIRVMFTLGLQNY